MPFVDNFKPFWQTTDGATVKLYQGHVLDVVRRLSSRSVQCVVTSPPYWGLRDYGTAEYTEGNDPTCTHKRIIGDRTHDATKPQPGYKSGFRGSVALTDHREEPLMKDGEPCPRCGAKRIDQQLGSEKSPDCLGWARGENCAEYDWSTGCHVCRMVLVFREVRRVLRDDGTLWLNYGDSYGSGDLPSGNLVGVPWRIALALQADGWILRQDIIWHKPSPMPESVTNRCTKAHEYVFLFVKRLGYFCDMEAVSEELQREPHSPGNNKLDVSRNDYDSMDKVWGANGTRNKRSVWSIASQGYPGAHFATFPPKLIEPMILVGTSAKGCCAKCGTPWKRVVDRIASQLLQDCPKGQAAHEARMGSGSRTGTVGGGKRIDGTVKTLGWEPGCVCFGTFVKREGKRLGYGTNHSHEEDGVSYGLSQSSGKPLAMDGRPSEQGKTEPTKEFDVTYLEYVPRIPLDQHPVNPCIVLDPFVGSGTTAEVCLLNDRLCWGIDLSEKYLKDNAIPRIEGILLSRPALRELVKIPEPPPLKLSGKHTMRGRTKFL